MSDIRQRWRERLRQWNSIDPMPITEDEEVELHTEFGYAFTSQNELDVFWFGDPHFGQRFRVAEQVTR